MEQGLVTVAVPVYKTAPYLERCIKSIVEQTYPNLEILLIDDGSPDECPQMCDAWAEQDSRIRVIHKENAGAGMARNTAIDQAHGEYICFIDSDDYIAPHTVERAHQRARESEADVVVFGLHWVNAAGEVYRSFAPRADRSLYQGPEVVEDFLPSFLCPDPKTNKRSFYMSNWVLLYSMGMIRESGWRFASEREVYSEDVYSQLQLYPHVQRVAVLSESLYYYCDNDASISRQCRTDRLDKIKQFYLDCTALCHRLGYGEEILHRVSKSYLAFVISALKQESRAHRPAAENRARIREFLQDKVLQKVLEQNKKDKVKLAQAILFFGMRHRMSGLCYRLFRLK